MRIIAAHAADLYASIAAQARAVGASHGTRRQRRIGEHEAIRFIHVAAGPVEGMA